MSANDQLLWAIQNLTPAQRRDPYYNLPSIDAMRIARRLLTNNPQMFPGEGKNKPNGATHD